MNPWLAGAADRLAAATGIPRADLQLSSGDVEALLDEAGAAAHESGQRTNAPLLCFLLGCCVGRGATLAALRRGLHAEASDVER
jgi:Domain of unknown function (DUF6457)